MDALRVGARAGLLVALCFLLAGCQMGYLIDASYNHLKILSHRQDIRETLRGDQLSEEQKSKLNLAREAKIFAENVLGLKKTGNYEQYVDLKRSHVSYVVVAAKAYALEQYTWSFPVVGAMPYKGFFDRRKAEDYAKTFDTERYDTVVRGVAAYSTLGWFNDPVLSSMLSMPDHQLVNLIIHETVHATLFLRGEADFNERMATFFGDQGTELFYLQKEGSKGLTLFRIRDEAHDDSLFSEFISGEIDDLAAWYATTPIERARAEKVARLQAINTRFDATVRPRLRTRQYDGFASRPLNNASLLSLKTYVYDQSDFLRAYELLGRDFKKLLEFCKSLERSKDPQADLKAFARR